MSAVVSQLVQAESLLEKFGAEYYLPGAQATTGMRETDLYSFKTYVGKHDIEVAQGDCAYYLEGDTACVKSGPAKIQSAAIATVIRGYRAPNRTAQITSMTTLPFVNGCSTRQLFAPERIGDPTLQLLYIPPYTSEQVHHMHSTARVAYVLRGEGTCVVGMSDHVHKQKLMPGTTIIIHPMCPHHFETAAESLLVVPLHVFSSAPAGLEFNHPMYNGSHQLG